MRIERVSIRVTDPGRHSDPAMRGFACVAVEGGGLTLVIDNIRVIRRSDGTHMLVWPGRKVPGVSPRERTPTYRYPDGAPYHYRDSVHPADAETRRHFDRVVLGAYFEAVESGRDVLELRRPAAGPAVA